MAVNRDYKRPARKAAKSGRPMLTGIVIGLFIGLALALGVALFINYMPSPFLQRGKPAPAATSLAAPDLSPPGAKSAAKSADKPRFDFYTILPGTEEPVTEQDLRRAARQAGANSTKTAYFVQAGAFQTEAEADNLKAKLALLGVEAVIQTVSLPDKGVWHRVRMGPYSRIDDLERVRTLLARNDIKTRIIKLVADGQASLR